jgi:hypothetical protein
MKTGGKQSSGLSKIWYHMAQWLTIKVIKIGIFDQFDQAY